MTPSEAIVMLNYVGIGISDLSSLEGLRMGMEALSKQIPKKPIKKNPICYEKTKDGQEYFAFDYFCPNCNEQIKPSEHHCYCGQALEWGDTNE